METLESIGESIKQTTAALADAKTLADIESAQHRIAELRYCYCTLDTTGPLHGIPDFLRRYETSEQAEARAAEWRKRLKRMPKPLARVESAVVQRVALDHLRETQRNTNAEQAGARAIMLDAHREAARELAARSYLDVGEPVPAAQWIATRPLRHVTTRGGPVQNPRGPIGPRQDGLTDAERATIDQYFSTAYPGWKITKQGGTPTFFLRNGRASVWIEPVFQEHRLSTKQAEVIGEYLAAGFKVDIVPVHRLPRETMAA